MAAIDYFLANITGGGGWREVSTELQAAATLADGWIVSTGSTNHSAYATGTERAASTFADTTPPDGSLDATLHDAFRSSGAHSGNFASGDWVFHFVVRADTNGGAQDGRVRFRLFKANSDGTGATEITAGQQQASIVTDVSTSADFDSTLTFNPGAFSVNAQHLFLQVAWERTGAGGMSTSDIHFRTGSDFTVGTRFTTADFTAGTTLTVTAPVVTVSAPAATRSTTVTLGVTAPAVTVSAPAAGISSSSPQTLVCTAPVVALSAPAAAAQATNTFVVGAPVVNFSAPTATRAAAVALALGAPTVQLSAPTAILSIANSPQTLVATVPFITISAPTATRRAVWTAVLGAAPNVALSAPTALLMPGMTNVLAGTPTVVFSAPTATLLGGDAGPGGVYWRGLSGLSAMTGGQHEL